MRSSTVVALFAGSAAAQSSAVVFNPLMPAKTLTAIGSSSGTTTYVNSCSEGGLPASFLTPEASESAASSLVSSARSAAGTLTMTPIPAPSTTPAARLRRQEDEDGLFGGFCEPFALKQGSSSLEFHMQDPTEGAWTVDMNCAWKGELTSADISCTATNSGAYAELASVQGVTAEAVKASDAIEGEMIQTVAVVQSTSNSASPTASGTQSSSASTTASGTAAATSTGGAAAGAPLSKGVMAFVGGAAGVFAAALAL